MAHTRESTLVLFGASGRARGCLRARAYVALARMRPPRARMLGRAGAGRRRRAAASRGRGASHAADTPFAPALPCMPRQTWTAR